MEKDENYNRFIINIDIANENIYEKSYLVDNCSQVVKYLFFVRRKIYGMPLKGLRA